MQMQMQMEMQMQMVKPSMLLGRRVGKAGFPGCRSVAEIIAASHDGKTRVQNDGLLLGECRT